ncbi:MAG: hypothetical protein Q9209_006920 [Squamulea sp. 1 TL-2023]
MDLFGFGADIEQFTELCSEITGPPGKFIKSAAIWGPSTNLQVIVGVISIFKSASYHVIRMHDNSHTRRFLEAPRSLAPADWTTAVIKGTEGASHRSRQVLVLSGLLQGSQDRLGNWLSTQLQHTLVTSVNLSLINDSSRSAVTDRALVIAVSQVFDLLDVRARRTVNHDLLLPMLIEAMFFSEDGIHHGYFLGTIDADIVETVSKEFDWSARSKSYLQLQSLAFGPLVSELGRLSQLTAFSAKHAIDSKSLSPVLDNLFELSRSLCIQWRQNKLSEVDASEKSLFLADDTIKKTLPLLWRVLRSSMFSVVVILTAYAGRLLSDKLVARDDAPSSAIKILKILRNLYFITSELGMDALSRYSFVYLAAIDIVSQYPTFAAVFLSEIRPIEVAVIPHHPLDRCLDLYFLNTAEHFALILDTRTTKDLLVSAAWPYLGVRGEQRSLEAFEAAHSVMLATIAAPHNTDLAASHIETYINLLFEVFPQSFTLQQFRLAFTKIVRITSPPSAMSTRRPLLSSALLEVVRSQADNASSQPLPNLSKHGQHDAQPMSEHAVLVLALIDSLPFLQLDALEDWLPIAARLCLSIQDPALKHVCNDRLWELLSEGEMSSDRAALCVNWWNTGGGRETVLCGEEGSTIDQ